MGRASFGVLNQLLAEFSFYTNALLLDLYIQTYQDFESEPSLYADLKPKLRFVCL